MSIGPQRPEALLGQVIAGYELVEYIGTGATGLVFRGRLTDAPIVEETGLKPPALPDEAAIKLLVPPIGSTQKDLDEFRSRFIHEARILSEFDHPSILRVLAYGDDAASGMSYMVLPYMAGGSLARMIVERGPLPLAEVTRILTPIAAALDYAHRHDVVHRDVKPGNILLDAAGTPALGDFSIVRLLSEGGSLRTTTGRVMGTPAYMSPEQFDDSSKVGSASDIYGLGMVVYEMVTGRTAFAATSWAQAMWQQVQETPPEPRTLRPDLPEPAQAAILRALAKVPAQRFPTATAFAEAFALGAQGTWAPGLTRFVASLAPGGMEQTAPNARTVPAPHEPRRRSGVPFLVGALAVALIIACVAALALGGGGSALLARLLPGTPTGGPIVLATTTQTATPAGSGTPGRATATPKKGGPPPVPGAPTDTPIPGVPTDTPIVFVSPTAGVMPTPTFTPIPTATPTPTPVPPTPTPTPCPYLYGGAGVYFYDQQNYSGNSYLFYVAPGQVNTVVNLPSPIAGHLNSISDTNQAWTIVVYQGTNGSGNLGFYYSSQPNISSYWQATQSVKIYVNRSC